MAKYDNPSQIVRKDGKNCFVEVLSDSFAINRVRFNFCTYDMSAASGSRITSTISIFLPFDEFYRIYNDIAVTRVLLSTLAANLEAAKKSGSYPVPIILNMGGRSVSSLANSGAARPDGMALSRQMKLMAGDKFPVLLQAESGPGEQNEKGLIVPRYKTPEQKVMIPFTYETIKELFLITKAHVDAYITSRYVSGAMVTTMQHSNNQESAPTNANETNANSTSQRPLPASRTPNPNKPPVNYNNGYMPSQPPQNAQMQAPNNGYYNQPTNGYQQPALQTNNNYNQTMNNAQPAPNGNPPEINPDDIDLYLSMMNPN